MKHEILIEALERIENMITCDGPGCHWCEIEDAHPFSTAAVIARAALDEYRGDDEGTISSIT